MSQHTPTPWKAQQGLSSTSPRLEIVRADLSAFVAQVHRTHDGNKEAEANAAFIVRACNSHDALVEALSALEAELSHLLDPNNTNNTLSEPQRRALNSDHARAFAALALAAGA